MKGRKLALNLPAVKAKFENNNVTLDQVNRFIVLKYMSEEETDNDSNQLGMFDSNNEKPLYVKKPMYRSNKVIKILIIRVEIIPILNFLTFFLYRLRIS